LLDTAPWYGHGTSEIVVGYALDTILTNYEGVDAVHAHSMQALVTAGGEKNFSTPIKRARTGFLPRSSVILNTKVGRYEADPLRQFDFSYR
jgi:aryl-alcohol dehydrogenase-like predicted oxidoreductase